MHSVSCKFVFLNFDPNLPWESAHELWQMSIILVIINFVVASADSPNMVLLIIECVGIVGVSWNQIALLATDYEPPRFVSRELLPTPNRGLHVKVKENLVKVRTWSKFSGLVARGLNMATAAARARIHGSAKESGTLLGNTLVVARCNDLLVVRGPVLLIRRHN